MLSLSLSLNFSIYVHCSTHSILLPSIIIYQQLLLLSLSLSLIQMAMKLLIISLLSFLLVSTRVLSKEDLLEAAPIPVVKIPPIPTPVPVNVPPPSAPVKLPPPPPSPPTPIEVPPPSPPVPVKVPPPPAHVPVKTTPPPSPVPVKIPPLPPAPPVKPPVPSPPVKAPVVPAPPVSPPSYSPPPPPRNTKECYPPCLVRCKLHSRKNVCMRACVTCCNRCKCVPPGQFGNREKCGKCYVNMTTRGGRRKCP